MDLFYNFYAQMKKQYRSILCLNGTLPEKSFFEKLSLPIFAADGAANTLMAEGIKPVQVLGDLDSIHPTVRTICETVLLFDQQFCDFEKSLTYLEGKGLLPAIIVGMNGGYIDHILNNVNVFMQGANLFYAPPIVGFTLVAGEQGGWQLPINSKISLFGIPSACITSHGLVWELKQAILQFVGKNSAFNRTLNPKIRLEVHEGQALVLIYSNCSDVPSPTLENSENNKTFLGEG